MIHVVGGYKGGSGKTTTATNLAVFLLRQGKRVLYCDGDDQRTASTFNEVRRDFSDKSPLDLIALSGAKLHVELLRVAKGYDDVVVDVGGTDSTSQRAALAVADIYLSPFPPRAADLWTSQKVDDLIAQAQEVNSKLRAYSFLSRSDTYGLSGAAGQNAAAYLGNLAHVTFLPLVIGNRIVFDRALSLGLSVLELTPPDVKATFEVNALFNHLQLLTREKA
jgi:chromosome partitioning protein